MKSVRPFLMFQGEAGPALDLYVQTFPDAQLLSRVDGLDGKVQSALLSLKGQEVMVFDSAPVHAFSFTPAFSFFIECEDQAEQDRLAATLAEGGRVMMPMDDYGFSKRFTWLSDRFGISWQLTLN